MSAAPCDLSVLGVTALPLSGETAAKPRAVCTVRVNARRLISSLPGRSAIRSSPGGRGRSVQSWEHIAQRMQDAIRLGVLRWYNRLACAHSWRPPGIALAPGAATA